MNRIGEFEAIGRITGLLSRRGPGVELGIGDDCAIVQPPSSRLVLTTDLLLEGVHFPVGSFEYSGMGFRSAAATLSDIAAMGAMPAWLLIGLSSPSMSKELVDGITAGVEMALRPWDASVVGGDTTRSCQGIVLSVTGIGLLPPGGRPLTRSSAVSGDVICVTGTLGDAAAGLAGLQGSLETDDDALRYLKQRFWYPTPRIREGLVLAGMNDVHAAMDISDGLLQDLGHICRMSGVAAEVEPDLVPLSSHLMRAAAGIEDMVRGFALSGGEDFELLVTMSPRQEQEASARLREAGLAPLTRVGRVVDGRPGDVTVVGGWQKRRGFDHFSHGC